MRNGVRIRTNLDCGIFHSKCKETFYLKTMAGRTLHQFPVPSSQQRFQLPSTGGCGCGCGYGSWHIRTMDVQSLLLKRQPPGTGAGTGTREKAYNFYYNESMRMCGCECADVRICRAVCAERPSSPLFVFCRRRERLCDFISDTSPQAVARRLQWRSVCGVH